MTKLLLALAMILPLGVATVFAQDADRRTALETIARQFYEPFNGAPVDVYDDILVEDWFETPAPPDLEPGRAPYKANVAGLREMAPSLRIDVKEVLVEDDMVAVRSRLTATHDGDMFGVPATGRTFEIMTMDMHRFDGDRIAETWHVEDWLSALEQIGAMGGEAAAEMADAAEAPQEVDLYGPLFATVDRTGDGRISQRELNVFQETLFLTMDTDSDEVITAEEFIGVDFGESYEAGKIGREAEVRTALEAFFARSDRDGDGTMTFDEHRRVFFEDWRKADTFGNGALTYEEFTTDLPIVRELTAILSDG